MRYQYNRGFTIVEIAVAIVIMAILVGLVMVSFNAAIDNARVSTLKSNLAESASELKKEKANNGSYPATSAQADDFLRKSDGVQMQYNYASASSSYCLQGTIDGFTYHITPDRTEALEGQC